MKAYDQAILAFERSIEFDDSDAQAFYNLALANFKSRDYEKAAENFELCTQKDPLHRYAWNNLCFMHVANHYPK